MNVIFRTIQAAALAVIAALISGCAGSRTQDARALAEDFAKAYYSADYPTAAGMCSSELEQMVRETGSVVDSLPEAAQEEFLELSRGVQTYAVDVHEWSRDSVTVDFDIIYPGEIEPMKTALTVVRNPETDVWKVVYAQERM